MEKLKEFFRAREQEQPILTWIASAVCVGIFVGVHLEPDWTSWAALSRWGVRQAFAIREGAYWALVSCTLVHVELWHLVFNVYWLWRFGTMLERTIGSFWWACLYVVLAFVSASAELSISDVTGIGASGVLYGFFGFMWFAKEKFPEFHEVVDGATARLFFIWLFVCVLLTKMDVLQVANGAHFAGIIMGSLIGLFVADSKKRPLAVAGLAAFMTTCLMGLFWAPWSYSWATDQAEKAYRKHNLTEAEEWLKKSVKLAEDPRWSWDMLARTYVSRGDIVRYREAVSELRKLDPQAAERLEKEMSKYLVEIESDGEKKK